MTLSKNTKPGRSKYAKARRQLTSDQFFFFEHAGYSYDPKKETAYQGRLRCAMAMAEAEATAQRLGWEFEWEWDEDADLSWMSEAEQREEHEVTCCRVFDPKDEGAQRQGTGYRYATLASVCGVVDADANYRRVVEAELAEEALARYDAEIEILDAH